MNSSEIILEQQKRFNNEKLAFKRMGYNEWKLTFKESSKKNFPRVVLELNGFTIEKGHSYYWCVEGQMPVKKAEELWRDPIGRTDIRVTGHCGCPSPSDPWLTYIDPETGKEVLKQTEKAEFERLKLEHGQYLFSEDRKQYPAFVSTYHVDSELGLYVLLNKIKEIKDE